MRTPEWKDFWLAIGIATSTMFFMGMGAYLQANQQQQTETQIVMYDVVKVACELPAGCELTLQEQGKGRPMTVRCRDGCVLIAQDTVIAQTTLKAIYFNAAPDSAQ